MQSWSEDEKYLLRAKQGLPSPFIDIHGVNDHGEVPWDGKSPGELEICGPFVAAGDYKLSDSPSPGAGKLVRVSPSGELQDMVTGLVLPTAIKIGPDGAIYISNFGAALPGLGQILRVEITD